jgi:hypothetical protein
MGTYGILLPCDGTEPLPVSVGDYKDIQSKVGGLIDAVRFDYDDDAKGALGLPTTVPSFTAVGYIHDEGRLLNLKLNAMASIVFGQQLYGPVVVVSGTSVDGDYDGDNHDVPDWFLDKVFDGSLHQLAELMQADAMTQAKAMKMAYRDGVFTEQMFDEIIEWMESDDPDYQGRIDAAISIAMIYYEGRSNGTIGRFDRDAFEKWATETDFDSEITRFMEEEGL